MVLSGLSVDATLDQEKKIKVLKIKLKINKRNQIKLQGQSEMMEDWSHHQKITEVMKRDRNKGKDKKIKGGKKENSGQGEGRWTKMKVVEESRRR